MEYEYVPDYRTLFENSWGDSEADYVMRREAYEVLKMYERSMKKRMAERSMRKRVPVGKHLPDDLFTV